MRMKIRVARRAAMGMLALILSITPFAVALGAEETTPCDQSDLCKAMYSVISQRKASEIEPFMPTLVRLLPEMSAADIRKWINQDINAQIADHISQRLGYGLSSADKARTLSDVTDTDLKGWLFGLAKVIDSPPTAMTNAELNQMMDAYVLKTRTIIKDGQHQEIPLEFSFNPVKDSITKLHQMEEELRDKLELPLPDKFDPTKSLTLCTNTKDDDSDGLIDANDPDCAITESEAGDRRAKIFQDISFLRSSVRDTAAQFRTLVSAFRSQAVRANGTVADAQSNLASVLEETFFNHFNVDYNKALIDGGMGQGGYEPTIHEKMFTTFHALLSAVIKHPAMLVYLDNQANRFDLVNKVASNQNLGRELLELHTLGLGPDKAWRAADGSRQPKLYTQKDVENSALLLTGFNVGAGKMDEMGAFKYGTEINYLAHVPDYLGTEQTSPVVMGKRFCLFDGVKNKVDSCGPKPPDVVTLEAKMATLVKEIKGLKKSLRAADDKTRASITQEIEKKKTLQSQTEKELKALMVSKINTQLDNYLRILSNHERTKVNICMKLANRFVVPDYIPTGVKDEVATRIDESKTEVQRSAVVDRCIAAWGQDGDLKAMYRAILTSPEVWSARNYQRMTKNPNDLVISAIRASGVTVNDFTDAKEVVALGARLKTEIDYLGLPYRKWITPTGYNERYGWIGQGYLVRWITSSFRLANYLESRSGPRGSEQFAPIMIRRIPAVGGGEISAEQACRTLVDKNNQPDGKERYKLVRELLGYGDVRPEVKLIQVKTERMMSKDGSAGTGENYLMVKQKINGAWGASCVKSGLTSITASARFLRQ